MPGRSHRHAPQFLLRHKVLFSALGAAVLVAAPPKGWKPMIKFLMCLSSLLSAMILATPPVGG